MPTRIRIDLAGYHHIINFIPKYVKIRGKNS